MMEKVQAFAMKSEYKKKGELYYEKDKKSTCADSGRNDGRIHDCLWLW